MMIDSKLPGLLSLGTGGALQPPEISQWIKRSKVFIEKFSLDSSIQNEAQPS